MILKNLLAINTLNKGKAADITGIMAEHIKEGDTKLSVLPAMCFNKLLAHSHLPKNYAFLTYTSRQK